MKERKNMKKYIFFPTYLTNQKIQGRSTANKQFFNDGLMGPNRAYNKYIYNN